MILRLRLALGFRGSLRYFGFCVDNVSHPVLAQVRSQDASYYYISPRWSVYCSNVRDSQLTASKLGFIYFA